jgi:Domain of unknown function (DUF4961)
MKKIKLRINKKTWSWAWKITGTVIIIVIISCNLTISSVNQPATASGGSVVPITLNCTITSNNPQTSALVVGILVPKIWNASSNTTVTFTADQTTGPQPMSLIPPNTPSPYGNGLSWQDDMMATVGHANNLIPEYEWIAFQSNQQYAYPITTTETVTVSIQIKVSDNNVLFNMAYVLAESTDGLHSTAYSNPSTSYYGTFFPPAPIRINGTGTLMDFVNPQLSTVVPGSSLDNDIITIPFNATASNNSLTSANQVFLCATGFVNGDSIKVCEQTDKTKLISVGQGQWQTNIWPRGFFNLSPAQRLDSIEYFFTDATGATKVGYGGKASPFSFTFSCQ